MIRSTIQHWPIFCFVFLTHSITQMLYKECCMVRNTLIHYEGTQIRHLANTHRNFYSLLIDNKSCQEFQFPSQEQSIAACSAQVECLTLAGLPASAVQSLGGREGCGRVLLEQCGLFHPSPRRLWWRNPCRLGAHTRRLGGITRFYTPDPAFNAAPSNHFLGRAGGGGVIIPSFWNSRG